MFNPFGVACNMNSPGLHPGLFILKPFGLFLQEKYISSHTGLCILFFNFLPIFRSERNLAFYSGQLQLSDALESSIERLKE